MQTDPTTSGQVDPRDARIALLEEERGSIAAELGGIRLEIQELRQEHAHLRTQVVRLQGIPLSALGIFAAAGAEGQPPGQSPISWGVGLAVIILVVVAPEAAAKLGNIFRPAEPPPPAPPKGKLQ